MMRIVSLDFDNLNITVDIYEGFSDITDTGEVLHAHNKYEMFFVLAGNTGIKTPESAYKLQKNDVCLIPPGILHYSSRKNEGLMIAGIFFSFKKAAGKNKNDFYSIFNDAYSSLTEPLVLVSKTQSIEYLRRLIASSNGNAPMSAYECEALCALIFTDITESLMEPELISGRAYPKSNEKDVRAELIADYMERNYMKDISLKSLSEVLHICEKHTSLFFKKSFNMYFKEYLTELRIDAAKRLILNTDKSLTEISEQVGYKSYNGFYGFFKRLTGLSPAEYKEQATKEKIK